MLFKLVCVALAILLWLVLFEGQQAPGLSPLLTSVSLSGNGFWAFMVKSVIKCQCQGSSWASLLGRDPLWGGSQSLLARL